MQQSVLRYNWDQNYKLYHVGKLFMMLYRAIGAIEFENEAR
jgi:hypothetical protein